jgi:hypothetical protein
MAPASPTIFITPAAMQAISEIVEITGPTLHYTLPEGFEARRVQLIILPADLPAQPLPKPNRIRSLRGSIKGSAADSLNDHLSSVRNEW